MLRYFGYFDQCTFCKLHTCSIGPINVCTNLENMQKSCFIWRHVTQQRYDGISIRNILWNQPEASMTPGSKVMAHYTSILT